MQARHLRLSLITALLLGGASLAASAQQGSMNPMHQYPMHRHDMATSQARGMLGEHDMPGTVTAVDHQTGIVKVESLGMPLVVHFPPPTIKDLKAGDTISLHLGYRITGM